MRDGLPPALANAPCSRLRSCLMAWTRRISSRLRLHGAAHDRHLDLLVPARAAGLVAGAGEGHAARGVDLAGHDLAHRRLTRFTTVSCLT